MASPEGHSSRPDRASLLREIEELDRKVEVAARLAEASKLGLDVPHAIDIVGNVGNVDSNADGQPGGLGIVTEEDAGGMSPGVLGGITTGPVSPYVVDRFRALTDDLATAQAEVAARDEELRHLRGVRRCSGIDLQTQLLDRERASFAAQVEELMDDSAAIAQDMARLSELGAANADIEMIDTNKKLQQRVDDLEKELAQSNRKGELLVNRVKVLEERTSSPRSYSPATLKAAAAFSSLAKKGPGGVLRSPGSPLAPQSPYQLSAGSPEHAAVSKLQKQLQYVQEQSNGTIKSLNEEVASLRRQLRERGGERTPSSGTPSAASMLTAERRLRGTTGSVSSPVSTKSGTSFGGLSHHQSLSGPRAPPAGRNERGTTRAAPGLSVSVSSGRDAPHVGEDSVSAPRNGSDAARAGHGSTRGGSSSDPSELPSENRWSHDEHRDFPSSKDAGDYVVSGGYISHDSGSSAVELMPGTSLATLLGATR